MLQLLEAEIRTFESRLDEFLREHPGEFVLIHGSTVYGFFGDQDRAIAEGYRLFGGQAFMAQKVEVEQPARFGASYIRPPNAR